MKEIRWAVLGTGVIANEMAAALKKNGRNIYAVGNRTHSKAVAFAEKYGINKVYDDFNEMFEYVLHILQMAATGDDPDSIEKPEAGGGCSGDCSSCGGCG